LFGLIFLNGHNFLASLLSLIITMLAKITSKNQLTLPKSVVNSVGKTDYFEVEVEKGRIVLTPVRIQKADAVRTKLEALGIDTQDVADAVAWARKNPV
jgi:cysteinyl-tRNA synthetase